MIKVAVIGYGKQGQRLALKFHELGALLAIYDDYPPAIDRAMAAYPETPVHSRYTALLNMGGLDAVAIATVTPTHYYFAKEALQASKDVLVEKPLTNSSEQAEALVELAATKGRILMVGHTTLYLDGVEELRKQELVYYHSLRTNPDGFREDDDALWRLLPHDVALSMYLLGSEPKVGTACADRRKRVISTIVTDLEFDKSEAGLPKAIAGLYGSWDVGGDKIRDVHVYNSGGERIVLPETGDPLKKECAHFLHCIKTREKPLTDGEFGLKVVRVLEEIERKLGR